MWGWTFSFWSLQQDIGMQPDGAIAELWQWSMKVIFVVIAVVDDAEVVDGDADVNNVHIFHVSYAFYHMSVYFSVY